MTESVEFEPILSSYRPKKSLARLWSKRSAVAVVLDAPDPERASFLFIKRAEFDGDPWSGHMAFPGGRFDEGDRNGLSTAVREMAEEVGFDIEDAESQRAANARVVGRLSDVWTSRRVIARPMIISPYVILVDERPPLTPNYEVAETLWIPYNFFADQANRSELSFEHAGMNITLPCYRYKGRVIWGLTLAVIDDLMRTAGVAIKKV